MRLSVSCIVPVHNAEAFLAPSLASLRAQGLDDLEVIVIDDGSTDNTRAIIEQHADLVRLVTQDNAGPSAARNHGIRLAEGEVVAFLDADDLFPDDRFTASLDRLAADPELELVQGRIEELEGTAEGAHTFSPSELEPYRFVNLGSWLFRRSVFERIGDFDESLHHLEDVDWFLRAWDLEAPKTEVDETTLFYRRYEGSLSFGQPSHELGLARVIRRHLGRRREGAPTPARPFLDYVGSLPPERRQPILRNR